LAQRPSVSFGHILEAELQRYLNLNLSARWKWVVNTKFILATSDAAWCLLHNKMGETQRKKRR